MFIRRHISFLTMYRKHCHGMSGLFLFHLLSGRAQQPHPVSSPQLPDSCVLGERLICTASTPSCKPYMPACLRGLHVYTHYCCALAHACSRASKAQAWSIVVSASSRLGTACAVEQASPIFIHIEANADRRARRCVVVGLSISQARLLRQ